MDLQDERKLTTGARRGNEGGHDGDEIAGERLCCPICDEWGVVDWFDGTHDEDEADGAQPT